MQQATLTVQGMSCGHCVNIIEKNVSKLGGIVSVDVLIAEEKVNAVFDSNAVSLEEITDAIKNSGYEVVGEPTKDESYEPSIGCSCCH